jgi:hypothetical protein
VKRHLYNWLWWIGLRCLTPLQQYFSYIMPWWSVLLVNETGIPWENHRPVASHWQTLFLFFFLGWMSFSTDPWWLVTSTNYKCTCLYAFMTRGGLWKVHLNIIHVVSFWIDAWKGTVAASGNNQLPCPLYWVCLSDTCCVSYVI